MDARSTKPEPRRSATENLSFLIAAIPTPGAEPLDSRGSVRGWTEPGASELVHAGAGGVGHRTAASPIDGSPAGEPACSTGADSWLGLASSSIGLIGLIGLIDIGRQQALVFGGETHPRHTWRMNGFSCAGPPPTPKPNSSPRPSCRSLISLFGWRRGVARCAVASCRRRCSCASSWGQLSYPSTRHRARRASRTHGHRASDIQTLMRRAYQLSGRP